MRDWVKNQITTSIQVKQAILENDSLTKAIEEVSLRAVELYQHGHKVILAGNGGSAADAQHLAGEFVSRFYFDRPGLPAMALTTDTSVITAIGNDYGFERLFARQVQANGRQGDMFIGISTSGNSANIVDALSECRGMRIVTVGLTGRSGGKMKELSDYCIQVPSDETPRIQEAHIMIGHIICSIVEAELFGDGAEK